VTTSSRTCDPFACEGDRYQDALRYLYDRINYERLSGAGASRYPFRLQRVTELLRRLDLQNYLHAETPQPKVPLVHIAGTKGKGSVAAMVAAALTACGLRTGLYTSPHLHRLEERFRINGNPCSAEELVSLVQRVKTAVDEVEQRVGGISFFELTTAIAMLHFEASHCEAIVIEVGLGGRLDSTNVLAPSVSAVTSIGLDHQHVLGHDLPTIAAEKAGIIKPGVPVVSGVADREAAAVVAQRAAEMGSPLFWIGRDFTGRGEPLPRWGSTIRYEGITPPLGPPCSLQLSMEGGHQVRNAAIALAIVDLLRAGRDDEANRSSRPEAARPALPPLDLPRSAVASALGQLQCEARIEGVHLRHDVLAIIDAAHNEDSIAALCDCLTHRSADRPVTVVFGTSLDKSAETMLKSLATVADHLILTRYHGNPRFRPPAEMTPLVPEAFRASTEIVEDPIEACRRGLRRATPGGTLVVCGSFFLTAETRHWLLQQPRAEIS
jgi:dihydrofolate synthase/folylpolyglutamate synthase